MSQIAMDIQTRQEVTANSQTPRKDYRCCNPFCHAVLRIRKGDKPCFFALETYPHKEGCPYANSSSNNTYILPEDFLMEDFINYLENIQRVVQDFQLHNNSFPRNKHKDDITIVRTVKQFFDLCQKDIQLYNLFCIDEKIDPDLFINIRQSGILGCKVIKGMIKFYKNNNCIVIRVKNRIVKDKFLDVKITMNSDLYMELKNKLRKRANTVKDAEIVICANFQIKSEITEISFSSGNINANTNTTTHLKSCAQVYVFLQDKK